jgi:hypothetical protein
LGGGEGEMKTEENTQVQRNIKERKKQVDGVDPRKSGEGTMMEQSPEMIGGAGRQTHLMRSFVSRHNHNFSGFLFFPYFPYFPFIFSIFGIFCIFSIYLSSSF